jgi:twitching motility protein PilT
VVLGEMADAETIDTAVKAAERGHLVIASLPTPDVVTTIERVHATLPSEEREIGRMRFSESLRAVISQQLLPQKGEKGRIAAVEVLITTPAVRECLSFPSRTTELRRHMADGKKQYGTQTYEQHLAELVEAGLITQETSKAAVALAGLPGTGGGSGKKGSKQASA